MREMELQGQVNALKAENERQSKLIGQVIKLSITQVMHLFLNFDFVAVARHMHGFFVSLLLFLASAVSVSISSVHFSCQ